MRQDVTSITLIVDRSGSMSSVQQEAENGINHFLDEQKKLPGECLLTLVQFDTDYEVIHAAANIRDIPRFALVPRGMTALLDAVGKAINTTGETLAAIDEAARPGKVICVIVTDGHENSSHEFTKAQIREMIERQRRDYAWEFSFIGADAAAFDEAGAIGIAKQTTGQYNPAAPQQAYAAVSCSVARYRMGGTADFTEAERNQMIH